MISFNWNRKIRFVIVQLFKTFSSWQRKKFVRITKEKIMVKSTMNRKNKVSKKINQ
jgi:hypothetical protein